MNQIPIKNVEKHKHLGLIFSCDGGWNSHIDEIVTKANSRLNIIRKLKFKCDRRSLEQMYFSYIRSLLEYVDVIWDNCPDYLKGKLEDVNREAARIVTGATKLVSIDLLFRECGWETLESRRRQHKLILFHKMVNHQTPDYLSNLIPQQFHNIHRYGTRNSSNIISIQTRTTYYFNSFLPSTIRLWNELPANIKNNRSDNILKSFLKIAKKFPHIIILVHELVKFYTPELEPSVVH